MSPVPLQSTVFVTFWFYHSIICMSCQESKSISSGVTVGCIADLDAGILSFAINGRESPLKYQVRCYFKQFLSEPLFAYSSTITLWARMIKNPDVSTGPLTCPFAHAFARSLTSLTPELVGMWMIRYLFFLSFCFVFWPIVHHSFCEYVMVSFSSHCNLYMTISPNLLDQVECGSKLFPAVIIEPTSKELFQIELGRTKVRKRSARVFLGLRMNYFGDYQGKVVVER